MTQMELLPTLPLHLFHGRNDSLPTCRPLQSPQLGLLPSVPLEFLTDLFQERFTSQHQSTEQPTPWRFQRALLQRLFSVLTQRLAPFRFGSPAAQTAQRLTAQPGRTGA